jgi:simple sugar transport system permease protein
VKIALFMTTALCSALVGIMIALRLASMQAGQGVGDEFNYIIAAVVGGLIIGMAFIGIQFSGWNTDWRYLFLGVILLMAVLVNNFVRRSAEGARK